MYVFRTISSEVMLSALFKVTAALKFSHKSNLSHLVLLSAAVCPPSISSPSPSRSLSTVGHFKSGWADRANAEYLVC